MIVRPIARAVGAAAIALLALTYSAQAQQQPSPAAIALATQLLEIKGGLAAFDPAIDGVIIHHKSILLQINPNLTKDIDAVGAMMTRGCPGASRRPAPRGCDRLRERIQRAGPERPDCLLQDAARQEVIEAEPKAGQEFTQRAQDWVEKYAETTMEKMRAEMKKRGHTEF